MPREMVEPLWLPVVHKFRVPHSLVCGSTPTLLTLLSPGAPVILAVFTGQLGHELVVPLELRAAQHSRSVVLGQSLFHLSGTKPGRTLVGFGDSQIELMGGLCLYRRCMRAWHAV